MTGLIVYDIVLIPWGIVSILKCCYVYCLSLLLLSEKRHSCYTYMSLMDQEVCYSLCIK